MDQPLCASYALRSLVRVASDPTVSRKQYDLQNGEQFVRKELQKFERCVRYCSLHETQ